MHKSALTVILASVFSAQSGFASPQTAQSILPNENESMRGVGEMLHEPHSLLEFLKNIKLALSRELFLTDKTYTNENLKSIFGDGAHLEDSNRLPKNIKYGASFILSTNIFENSQILFGEKVELSLQIQEKNDKNQRRGDRSKVFIGIPGASLDPRMTVDLMQSVFSEGAEVKISDSPYLSKTLVNPVPLSPATHGLGNKIVEYYFRTSKTQIVVGFVTMPGGQVRNVNINQLED